MAHLHDKYANEVITYSVVKGEAVYNVALPVRAWPLTDGRITAVYRASARELGESDWQPQNVIAGELALAQIKRAEGNVIAARAVFTLLGTGKFECTLSKSALEDLIEGEGTSKKIIRLEILEYIDRRMEEYPKPPPTLIEILSALPRNPNRIIESLNNLSIRGRLLLASLKGPDFPTSFDSMLSAGHNQEYEMLQCAVNIIPGADDKVHQEAEEYRRRAKDQPVIVGPLRAFISYSTKDAKLAGQIQMALEKHGVKAFLAHASIEPSKKWMTSILNELNDCHVFLALLTENYRGSEWTDHEAGYADARDKKIFPLKVLDDPHGFLSKFQAVDLDVENVAPACEKIFEVIRDDAELSPLLSQSASNHVT
ncbi:MAG: toll/interleukin-1 receptor domain-containing protein [candidate division Zixibacteria bacterium]|nr:toll/interleukin-1 receptor domain-containing protein [candidate division Zixibacteria bacterium]MDH3937597.1 toll/interleukin-1 receptor domain-containing protein [candidate division Zixibacteria bacterium]